MPPHVSISFVNASKSTASLLEVCAPQKMLSQQAMMSENSTLPKHDQVGVEVLLKFSWFSLFCWVNTLAFSQTKASLY